LDRTAGACCHGVAGAGKRQEERLSVLEGRKCVWLSSGRISVKQDSYSDTIGMEFWLKALSLMNHLEQIYLKSLLSRLNDWNGNRPEVLIYKVLLSVPGLTTILVPPELDSKCLDLLHDRKDWTITVNEE
jgi:hypothetical protein